MSEHVVSSHEHQLNPNVQSQSSAEKAPKNAAHPLQQLQKTVGNQATQALLNQGAVAQSEAPKKSGGQPLPAGVKAKMEHAFQSDFSNVKLHVDSNVEKMGARAYAQGNDVHFSPAAYSPNSKSGQQLIGHELAHVVQQRNGTVHAPQAKGLNVNTNEKLENDADRAGQKAANGERAHQEVSASASHSNHSNTTAPATAPIQGSFFGSMLGGLKKAGGAFMAHGGMDILKGAASGGLAGFQKGGLKGALSGALGGGLGGMSKQGGMMGIAGSALSGGLNAYQSGGGLKGALTGAVTGGVGKAMGGQQEEEAA